MFVRISPAEKGGRSIAEEYFGKCRTVERTITECIKEDILESGVSDANIVHMNLESLRYRDADRGHIIENIVFLELLRRDYRVYIGKMGEMEVDFVWYCIFLLVDI